MEGPSMVCIASGVFANIPELQIFRDSSYHLRYTYFLKGKIFMEKDITKSDPVLLVDVALKSLGNRTRYGFYLPLAFLC